MNQVYLYLPAFICISGGWGSSRE